MRIHVGESLLSRKGSGFIAVRDLAAVSRESRGGMQMWGKTSRLKNTAKTLLSLLLLFAGCGQGSSGHKQQPSQVSKPQQPPAPAPFPPEPQEDDEDEGSEWVRPDRWRLADPGCSKAKAVSFLGKQVRIWVANKEGRLTQQEFDLSDFSGVGLANEYIAEAVLFTSEVESQWADSAVATKRLLFARAKESGSKSVLRPLYFCRESGAYPRHSLENAALAALLGVRQAYLAHKNLKTKAGFGGLIKHPLPKLRLLVHPLYFEHEVRNGRRTRKYQVDNAFWGVSTGAGLADHPFIAVLPHSQASAASLGFYYWELPAWFAHEYGHHIFATYIKRGLATSVRFKYQAVLDGFNEAFADLIAHYSFAAEGRLFSSLRSPFALDNRNREVRESELRFSGRDFFHKTDKIFSSAYLDFYLGYKPLASSHAIAAHAAEFSFMKDCHYFGAIVAHAFYSLLEPREYLGLAVAAPVRHPLEALLSWAKQLSFLLKYESSRTHKEFVNRAIEALVYEAHAQFWPRDTSASTEPSSKEELAWWAQVKKLFPDFYASLIEGEEL